MRETDRLSFALEKSRSVAYAWDIEGKQLAVTGDLRGLLQWPESTDTIKASDFLAQIHKHDVKKYEASIALSAERGGDYKRIFQWQTKQGVVFPILDQGACIRVKEKPVLIGLLSASLLPYPSHEQGPIHNAEEEQLLLHHGFDAIDHRAQLVRIIQESKDSGRNSVLLAVSVDNLPMMITWYSVEFAHRIMDALAISIGAMLREGDSVHRIALDQLGIILRYQSPSEAELVVDRVMKKIQLYSNPSFAEPVHLRCSFGSVYMPHDAHSAGDALNKAFLALSSARSSADEYHVNYLDAKREHLSSKEEVAKLNYMQSALEEDRLRMAFQPIVSAQTGIPHSYECLLRIADNHGSIQSAGSLIPIAEKLGMIDLIDRFVMQKIIEELQQDSNVVLGFNVSNMTTDNPQWLKLFTRMLKDEQIAKRVIIEITETAAQHDLRQTAYFVAALQALGCTVVLDDFGAGYTSFRQLKSLSVDMVKIDGSYIQGLETNSENQLFIRTLVEFNKAYGLETVAECVENGEVAKILMEMGVEYMQGYYFGKPTIERPWRQAA
jgi:EAL domain-containing protein (putative c-di-GMP-specific phosphodiesterase class I)/GGDEF domain-containing protein